MAILTDDQDIDTSYFNIIKGGNGDYYPHIFYRDQYDKINRSAITRISMSGGNCPSDIKMAIHDLYILLEKYNLNIHPLNDQIAIDELEKDKL